MSESLVVKRGRPPGSKNKEFRNWQPKKWKVDYEMVLLLHVSGKTNKEISETVEYSEIQIGNILGCELAKEKLRAIGKRLADRGASIEEKLMYIMKKSVDRVVNYMDNDVVFENQPSTAVTKAMQCMEMIDVRLRTGSKGGDTTHNTIILASEENVNKLFGAMDKSNRARELHAGEYGIQTVERNSGVGVSTATNGEGNNGSKKAG